MKLLVREYVTFDLRIVILFLTAMGKMAAEIHKELVQMYGVNFYYIHMDWVYW